MEQVFDKCIVPKQIVIIPSGFQMPTPATVCPSSLLTLFFLKS